MNPREENAFTRRVVSLHEQKLALEKQCIEIERQRKNLETAEAYMADAVAELSAVIERLRVDAPEAIPLFREAVDKTFHNVWVSAALGENEEPADETNLEDATEPDAAEPDGEPPTEIGKEFGMRESEDAGSGDDSEEDAPVASAEPYSETIYLDKQVAYQRSVKTGEIMSAYLGGKNKQLLQVWARQVCKKAGSQAGFEVRDAKRLRDYRYEVKFWGLGAIAIQSLLKIDTAKSPKFPPSEAEEKPQKREKRIDEPSSGPDSQSPQVQFGIGDRVRVLSNRHGDNLIGLEGLVSAPSKLGATVNITGILHFFFAEELRLIESAAPRKPAHDLSVVAATTFPEPDDGELPF